MATSVLGAYLARLKFQPRTRRISATPVAKRFEFASEQYFPRGIAMFGLISGIIMSVSRAHVPCTRTHTHTQLLAFSLFLNIIAAFSAPDSLSLSHVPVLTIRLASFFFSFVEINRGRWIGALRPTTNPLFLPRNSLLGENKTRA